MRPTRVALGVVAAAAAFVAVPSAVAKDRVQATLRTPIPLDAAAGKELHVSWTLADPGGRPFGANGVFVRLLSASGGRAETGVAPSGTYSDGRYAATVVVPEGGIGDVRIGLKAWVDGKPSAMVFPITNDPVPGAALISAPPDQGSGRWVFLAAAGALAGLALLAFLLSRRKTRLLPAAFLVAGLAVSTAGAKDFRPGDLRVCNAQKCVPVRDQRVLNVFSAFYYSSPTPPAKVAAARLGSPAYELRFRNGYATGVVATASFDRFLSFGVHLERFRKGVWYRVPERAAAEVRRLAAGLRPLRVTRATLLQSH